MIKELNPWMHQPITVAAKMGFLSRNVWQNLLCPGKPCWRNQKWRKLITRGLLATSTRYNHNSKMLVLTEKGRRIAEEMKLSPVFPPIADFISHDEAVLEIAIKLESEGLISSWRSEAELKRHNFAFRISTKQKCPDLLLELAVPGQKTILAVEVEQTRKSNERYREFLSRYKTYADVDTVIVLARSQVIIEAIKRVQNQTVYPQHLRPLVFGLLQECLEDPARRSLDFNGRPVSIQDVVMTLRRKRNANAQAMSKKLHQPLHSESGT